MSKTDKFNRMIEAFECDFSLVKENNHSIAELAHKIKCKDEKLMKDIELLEELSFLLRHGKAEIHLVSEPMTNADRIRNMTDEELAEFLCKLDTVGIEPKSIWNGEFWIDEGEELLKWLQTEVKEGESNAGTN